MSKNLLFLTPGLGKGGAETQLLKIANYLKSRHYNLLIVCLRPLNDFAESSQLDNLEVIFLKSWPGNFAGNVRLLLKTVKSFKPNVVIAFMFIGILFARTLKLLFPFKLISSVRNSVINRKWFLLFKISRRLDDALVFNAQASRVNFKRKGLSNDSKSLIIHNAVTIPSINYTYRSDEFVWISIAHFRASKDYQTLFRAVPLLANSNFKLLILGHTNGQTWPQEMIDEFGIGDKVQLLGFKTNALEYLQKSNALILSSFNEGMPNAIIEAMAFSKPVLASNIDGVKELLEASGGGLLFQPGCPDELARQMDRMMEMSNKDLEDLGARGNSYVQDNFAEDIILNRWERLIQSHLNK